MELETDKLILDSEKPSSIILEQQQQQHSKTNSTSLPFSHNRSNSNLNGSNSSTSNNTPPHSTIIKLLSLIFLILFTILSSLTLPITSLQNRLAILSISPLQFLLLSAIIILIGKSSNNKNKFGVNRILNNNNNNLEEIDKKNVKIIAILSVVTSLLSLWQSRWMDDKLWAALEVFIIPTLFLLPPILNHLYKIPTSIPIISESNYLTLISVVFLIGFSLVGIPAAAGGAILLALLRIPVEGSRWIFLKYVTGLDKPGSFLLSCCAWSFIFSSSILALSAILLKDHQVLTKLEFHNLLIHSTYSLLSQIFLLSTINLFSTPLIAGFALLPRNFILLLIGRGDDGEGIGGFGLGEGNWQQMLFVLSVGTLVTIITDIELYSLLPNFRSIKIFNNLLKFLPNSLKPTTPSSNPTSSPSSSTFSHHNNPLSLALVPFIPLFLFLLQSPSTKPSLSVACSYLPSNLRSTFCYSPTPSLPTDSTIDIVFAYYDEPLDQFRDHLSKIREGDFVKVRENRVIVYNKGYKTEMELRDRVGLREGDSVVQLENYGREGATYLKHILLHYNASLPTLLLSSTKPKPKPKGSKNKHLQQEIQPELADHTYFFQGHLAWNDIAEPRIKLVGLDTGFAHFGPYLRGDCGIDGRGRGPYPLVKEFYGIFTGEVCPPTGQLMTWSAQFVVSKRRILANSYKTYEATDKLMEAPNDHWIHSIWGPNNSGGASNPAAGHSLERSWPTIFGCSNPRIADECPDDIHIKENCQCLDSLDSNGNQLVLKLD